MKMGQIEFVSAGAGSGKTYKLTETVAEALQTRAARPQGILATTFTVKAATELRERVRGWLLEKGRIDLAMSIGQARIGTVNSVCGQFLKRFCFELGLSPDQTVLSETQSAQLLTSTVEGALDEARRAALVTRSDRLGMEGNHWNSAVHEIVKAALSNDISADAVKDMGLRNAQLMLSHWPSPQVNGVTDATLLPIIRVAKKDVAAYVADCEANDVKVADNLRKGLTELERLERVFHQQRWSWQDWYKASGLNAGAKVKDMVAPVLDATQDFEANPAFHDDISTYLDMIFQCAADALKTYARAKKMLGVVDFTDQEVLLLNAIRTSEAVRQALHDELDLIVVDEFQDTSPLQLALFIELARLAKRSVWVGDPKQAIYGFRGTDASLIGGVLKAIPGWGGTLGQPLTTSRRSTPALVSLTNAVFAHAFEPDLAPTDVTLQAHRQDRPKQTSLIHWQFESSKKENDYLGLGQAVSLLLAKGHLVEDKATGQLRPMQAGDIGILCPKNEQVASAVASLNRWNIPSASPRAGLMKTAEATLVMAALRRLHDPSDTVATALILSMAAGMTPEQWLTDRLDFLTRTDVKRHEWKATGEGADPLLQRLEALRPSVAGLTPMEAMRLAATESDVSLLSARWSKTPLEARARLANVEALLDLARKYEDECLSGKRPATISGLLRWLDERSAAEEDKRALTADDAVSVLTYHSAKGLEWPVVILAGIDSATRNSVWSIRARTEGDFDPAAPLDNRFIHCWLRPLSKQSKPPSLQNAEASPIGQMMFKESLAEHKRLLYVGLTRARDLNVLVSCTRGKGIPDLSWPHEIDGAVDILFSEEQETTLPDGRLIKREHRSWSATECALNPSSHPEQACTWFEKRPRTEAAPLWLRPSQSVGGQFVVAQTETIGHRLPLAGKPDMANLGNALHTCIARVTATGQCEEGEIDRILQRWGVASYLQAQGVCAQLKAFMQWCTQKWPGSEVLAEIPIEAQGPSGHRINGRIDFLIKTEQGWILIDHKANPRGEEGDQKLVSTYGPQLATYAQAIAGATNQPVKEAWLYQPVAGRAIRVF